jgi:WD40 repeat protein
MAVAVVLVSGQQTLGQQPRPWTTLKGHTAAVASLAWSPDGPMLASASWDGTVRLWEVANGKQRAALKANEGNVFAVAFSPGCGRFASGGDRGEVYLWETGRAAKEPSGSLLGQAPLAAVFALAFSPDGQTLAAAGGDVRRGRVRAVLSGHKDRVLGLATTRGGMLLASTSKDGTVRLWDATTGKQLQVLKLDQPVWCVAFSPDGKLLAAGDAGARFASGRCPSCWPRRARSKSRAVFCLPNGPASGSQADRVGR